MKKARTRSASLSNGTLTRDFIRPQENSNEDELAGLTKWLPNPCKPGVKRSAIAVADSFSGGRDDRGSGDLERCRDAGGCALERAGRRRRRAFRARHAHAESRSAGTGFRRHADGRAKERDSGRLGAGARRSEERRVGKECRS